jgi:hypothetical protein
MPQNLMKDKLPGTPLDRHEYWNILRILEKFKSLDGWVKIEFDGKKIKKIEGGVEMDGVKIYPADATLDHPELKTLDAVE